MANSSQPQLLEVALDVQDIVYTPSWVARDMVAWFAPSGSILEPSSGDGVFLQYLPPSAKWCEIEKGRDFYKWHEPVDWLFGNPPYAQFSKWLDHSMSIARNICYLIPCNKAFNSYAMIEKVSKWGGLAHMRVYAPGSRLRFPVGYAIGAVHYKKDYFGDMGFSLYSAKLSNTARSRPGVRSRKKGIISTGSNSVISDGSSPTPGG